MYGFINLHLIINYIIITLVIIVIRFVIIVVEIVCVITFAEIYVVLKFKPFSRKFYFFARFCYAVFFVLRGRFFCLWSASSFVWKLKIIYFKPLNLKFIKGHSKSKIQKKGLNMGNKSKLVLKETIRQRGS